MNEENSRKIQDIFKARIIASVLSMFFVIMGIATIYSYYRYGMPHSTQFKTSVSHIDIYMGLLQISLGLLPLSICFDTTKVRYVWAIMCLVIASIFLGIIYTNFIFK